MSKLNTVIRATFAHLAGSVRQHTIEGFANIKAAQHYANDNELQLQETGERLTVTGNILSHSKRNSNAT